MSSAAAGNHNPQPASCCQHTRKATHPHQLTSRDASRTHRVCLQHKPQMQADPGQDGCIDKESCAKPCRTAHTVNSTAAGSCALGNQPAPVYMPRWSPQAITGATGRHKCCSQQITPVLKTACPPSCHPATLSAVTVCIMCRQQGLVVLAPQATQQKSPPPSCHQGAATANRLLDGCEGGSGPWVLDKPASQQAARRASTAAVSHMSARHRGPARQAAAPRAQPPAGFIAADLHCL